MCPWPSPAVALLHEFRQSGITVPYVDLALYEQAFADVLGAMSPDEMLCHAQAFKMFPELPLP